MKPNLYLALRVTRHVCPCMRVGVGVGVGVGVPVSECACVGVGARRHVGNARYATVNPMKKLPEVGIICDASLIDGRGTIAKDGYFHGRGEWQAVDVTTGELVVQSHVQRRSTINIAELCAIIDSLMYLHDLGDTTTPVYNDNQYAVAWAISASPNTKLPRNADTMSTHYDLEERIKWLRENKPPNKILWYNSKVFGDNPADFGRK